MVVCGRCCYIYPSTARSHGHAAYVDATRYYLRLEITRSYDLLSLTVQPFDKAWRYYGLERTMVRLYDLLPAMAKLYGHAENFYNLARTMG